MLCSRLTFLRKEIHLSKLRYSVSAVAEVPHKMDAWGDDCKPEHMEDGRFLNFSLSLGHMQALENSYVDPVAFTNAELQPILEACHSISFGSGPSDDDVLSRVASDSEDLVGESCCSLPPTGQEKSPSPSYNESSRCTYLCCRQTGVGKRVWTNCANIFAFLVEAFQLQS